MNMSKIAIMAALVPLSILSSCRRAQAAVVEQASSGDAGEWTTDRDPADRRGDEPAGWEYDGPGGRDPFPLKSIQVHARIAGTIAHVEVDQVFGNGNSRPVEAVYVFPLPHEAAVHDLTIRMGGETVRAEIQRKDQARRTYQRAARQGRTAALLEQERPNLFQQSVANIPAGAELTVHTVMDVPVSNRGDWTEFVFPTAVGPRFCPPGRVPDLGKIGAPRLPEGMAPPQRLTLDLVVDAGLPIEEVESPTHDLAIEGPRRWVGPVSVRLREGSAIPNKDFVLRWKARGDRPLAAITTDGLGGAGHFLLQVQPPRIGTPAVRTPKDVVFLVDQSGSMSGEPLEMVKSAMRQALGQMEGRDRIQVVGFANTTQAFAESPVEATPENIRRAIRFVDGLRAGGGTEMLSGFRRALADEPRPGGVRIVCLMSDGFIGNEDEILQAVEAKMGSRTRVFALGTGSSVNRWFMEELAVRGRGQARIATLDEGPTDAVDDFLAKIRNPVLTGVSLEWKGVEVADVVPGRIPDLFDGEPLVVTGRFLSGSAGTLVVHGECGGNPLRLEVPVDPATGKDDGAVATVWARRRIEELSRSHRGSPDGSAVETMTRLALAHRLVSPYTSFVAVSDRVVNRGGRTETIQVPQALPEGVTERALGGGADKMAAVSGATNSALGSASSAGGASECRSMSMAVPSSPSAVMSASALNSLRSIDAGQLSEEVDPADENAVDLILAGGRGTVLKKGQRGSSADSRMESWGTAGSDRAAVGRGGRGSSPSGPAARAKLAPPRPTDVELGGEAGLRSPESILRVIRMNVGAFQYSYRKHLRDNPGLSGKLSLRFTIAPSGDIVRIEVVASNTGDAALDEEIKDKARRMKFDQIEKGNVTVTYALRLDGN
jgi:Ca-activated chloride channel family protein